MDGPTVNSRHGGHEDEDHELKNQTDHLKSHLEDELPRICADMFSKYENSIHKIEELETSNARLQANFKGQEEYIAQKN
jgi:adenylosuccinate lyase